MEDLSQYVQPGFVGFTGEEITESLEFLWQLSSQADVSIEDHNHELSKKIFNVLVLLFDRAVEFNFLKNHIDESGKQLTIQYDVVAVRNVLQLNETTIDDYINRGLQNVRECFEFRHFIACFFNSARYEKRFEIMLLVLSACVALAIKQNTRCINMLCLRFKLSSRKQKYHWIWQQIECIDELNILSLRDYLLLLENEFYTQNNNINHRNFNRNKTRINQLSNIITALDSALYFKQKGEHKKNFSYYYCHDHPDLFYDLLFDFYEIENSFVADDLSIDEQKDDEFESDDDFQCIDSTEIDTQNGNLDDSHIVVTGVDTKKYPTESAQKNWSELAYLHHTKNQSHFACNTHVLGIDDYVRLIKTLQRLFTHSNDDKTRKIVAILLCGVLYGISIEQLVLDLSSNKMKSFIDIDLNITKRPESDLSIEQISTQFLNATMSFNIPIDSTLIKAINKPVQVSFSDAKLYIKALRITHGLVYLSCRRIERALSVVFQHLGLNELLLDFIANQNKNLKTAIFYSGYAVNDIYDGLNHAHQFLGIDFKIIKPHHKSENNTRIGSQIALSYKYTESILNDLVYLVENTNCFVNRFNYYTLYMRFLIMLTTGMRPAGFNRLLLKDIDDSAQLFAITDKNNRSQANHRFIALCDFVKAQLNSYIAFIEDIQQFDLNHLVSTSGDIDAHDYALAVQSSIQTPFQFIHATNNKLYFSTRPPEVITDFTDKLGTQDNWPRHELRNFLSDESVNEAFINANYGHEAPFLESQHVFSSMTLNELKSATTDYQDNIIDLLAIQPISLKTLINKKHGANFQKYVLQPLSVQDQLTDSIQKKKQPSSNSTVLQREPLSNDKSWIDKGQQVSHIVDRCKTEWQQQYCFYDEQVIAYLAISLIVYSGIRSTSMLNRVFIHLADSNASGLPMGKRFINDTYQVHITFNSKHYGNSSDGDDVKNSHALIIDNISRLWLLRVRNRAIDATRLRELALNWHSHLANQLTLIQAEDDNKLTLNDFMQNANYVTEQQPNVNISVSLSNCLSAKIDTCGLTEKDFERYCYENAFGTKDSSNKDKVPEYILKSVNTEKNAILKSQVDFDKRVHKKILTAINLSNRASVLDSLKVLKAQQSHAASQRLISWLIYRLDDTDIKRIALSSLRTYFGYIGWRWLYFTEDLAVEHFSADDFDILYEDILSSTFDNSLAERAACLYHSSSTL